MCEAMVHGVLPKQTRNALWCAFVFLGPNNKGEVQKTQLQQIGRFVSEAVKKQHDQPLAEYLPQRKALTFDELLSYVQSYLMNAGGKADFRVIEQSCWRSFYQEKYLRVRMQWTRLGPSEEAAFKLWRIFNALSVDNTISPHEVLCLQERLLKYLRCTIADDNERATLTRRYNFWHFLGKFVDAFPHRVDAGKVQAAVEEMEDEILFDIAKQGTLVKKGHRRHNWKERWFCLTPGMLRYYTGRDKCLKGVIYINKRTKVERVEGKDKHQNRMAITCGDTSIVYEIAAPSFEEIESWMATIRFASQCNSRNVFEHAVIEKQKRWMPSTAEDGVGSQALLMAVEKYDAISRKVYSRKLKKARKEVERQLSANTIADDDACGVESTGHAPALERRQACASVDSAYGEGEDEGDMSSLSENELEQELETARAEIAKHEYLVLGQPVIDSPVF